MKIGGEGEIEALTGDRNTLTFHTYAKKTKQSTLLFHSNTRQTARTEHTHVS